MLLAALQRSINQTKSECSAEECYCACKQPYRDTWLCIYFVLQSSATASPSLNTVTINSDAENISDNEDDHQKTHGSHISSSNNTTHNNTQYFKSLRYYRTRDALPSENHYRNLLSIGESKDMRKFSRPTLDELHECEEKGQLLEGQKHAMIIGKV